MRAATPGETLLEGLLDLAAKKGLKTVVVIYEDDVGGRAVSQGAIELARKKGLQVVFADAFPQGTTDFFAILTKVRTAPAAPVGYLDRAASLPVASTLIG